MAEENRPPEEETTEEAPVEDAPVEETPTAEETPEEPTAAGEAEEAAEEAAPAAEEAPAEDAAPAAEAPAEEAPAEEAAPAPAPAAEAVEADDDEDAEAPAPREKPLIPGADLEVDIVREGEAALRGESEYDEDYEDGEGPDGSDEVETAQPIAVEIDLAAGARYRATGKRKTSVARVTLKPGTGAYVINGRTLEQHFPRFTLQRNIRQPLETVGYEERMDVVANLHGGGVSAQAGALRHGISRALLEADPNLRTELKRRGFLTRDPRVKERKKAGLKKARKRPQFSKR
jgi:small subunit ribosomal protein S9